MKSNIIRGDLTDISAKKGARTRVRDGGAGCIGLEHLDLQQVVVVAEFQDLAAISCLCQLHRLFLHLVLQQPSHLENTVQ